MNYLARAAASLAAVAIAGASVFGAEQYVVRSFEKRILDDKFTCEGANCADFNKDGVVDVVAGPYLFLGPDFKERREIYAAKPFDVEGYSENFFAFPYDIDGDGWLDVVSVGFPGAEACWFANPEGRVGNWERHVIAPLVDNESPTFADLTGDGKPELVYHTGGRFGYAEIPAADQTKVWRFRPISPNTGYERFNHGLGLGDVNGDGRMDVLERAGWWEQPASGPGAPQSAQEGDWKFHPVKFADAGGAQMFAYDLDGDGDNDVITSKAAHAYGLSWFEQVSEPGAKDVAFVEHVIMGDRPEQNDYGLAISELHAIALADVDGDGLKDIVTGKRWWAHSSHDAGALETPYLVWFKTVRESGKVRFVPSIIDDDSGVGTQVVVDDLNGDKLPDVVVGNKKGIFAFLQKTAAADKQAWEKSQLVKGKFTVATVEAKTQAAAAPAAAAAAPAGTPGAMLTAQSAPNDSFPATDASGKILNLDFETGDLSDWTAEGDAFAGQPIKGDTVARRRGDSVSGHAGDWWIGSFEVGQRDQPQGTLTSAPFKVTHPYATFLIGGGSHNGTRVDIVRADTGETVFSAYGLDTEQMRRVPVDLAAQLGKEVFLRVTDLASFGWGHINYDDFRFHDKKPELVDVQPTVLKADEYPYARISAEDAAKAMKLPPGFRATVVAAEPDVKQPIAMALDDRGRIWIAEAYEYPQRAMGDKGRDRILIFEDKDGDGKFDERKVFAEGLNLVSGLEVGFGGVWVGAAPYFMFIPDKDGDDVPDGPPQILLNGWGYQDTHETLNTFTWGPDGWLYGCHGVFTHSRVGKPGIPDNERIPINAGIWRYHPTRHKFEVFAEGTSNPWGIDFDDHGQAFETACVIPHLFHMIQGGRYVRQAGEPFNPYTYGEIQTIADHRHYLGSNPHGGNDRSDSAGGGHAHAGAMIYLGGAWPDKWRGQLIMNNIHGQRLNDDSLHRSGSGFIGKHEPDFLLTQDRASQMLNFRYGPDGQVTIIDWYDMQACHDPHADVHDRSNGRIYKVSYGEPTAAKPVDLKKLSDRVLAGLVLHPNDWFVRHSRRILQERFAAGTLDPQARERLQDIATTDSDDTRRLRAMWALHVTGGIDAALRAKLLADSSEYVRAWTIQLALDADAPPVDELLPALVKMAASDPSPVVRLYIASALGRIPLEKRWDATAALVKHSEDAGDHNLPLMDWYAAEPLAEADPQRALALGLSAVETLPQFAEFMFRRIGSLGTESSLAMLVGALGDAADAGKTNQEAMILRAIRAAFAGRRQVAAPAAWGVVYPKLAKSDAAEVRDEAAALGVTFGDHAALDAFRTTLASNEAAVDVRRAALETLLAAKDAKLPAALLPLLTNPQLRADALRGVAAYDDPATPAAVLAVYGDLPLSEKRAAVAALAARVEYARQLLKAIAEKKIPASDLSADMVRQLGNFKDAEIDRMVADAWGQLRSSPADKLEQIAAYKKLIESQHEVAPDRELGRTMFARTCQQCHTLYGVGAKIGPDLTGSNRANTDYLLQNVVDPNALIAKEYQTTVILTDEGRVISGIVAAEDDKSVTIKNTTETIQIPKDEIEDRSLSDASMMPENQLKPFTEHEVLSLFAYLQDKTQVPMLATKETAELLFNGKDLTGWRGDDAIWSVDASARDGGEIVGRMPGLEHNSFLVSDISADDFKLTFDVKLVDNAGNSGVQFHSEPLDGYRELRGMQADIGPDWWGKLYEENGRELLWDKSGEEFVKKNDWNKYEILVQGDHVQTWINGKPCVDYHDPTGAHRGVFALQMHSGGPTEVRFKNLKLETPPPAK